MEKNYNDQPELPIEATPLKRRSVEVEGQTYHQLTDAQLNALRALESGELYQKEVRAQQYKEERWDYVQLAQRNGSLFHFAKQCGDKAFRVFLYMIEHIAKDSNALMVTQTHLVKACGISISSVRRAIEDLKKAQVLDTVKVGKGTIYVFNAQVVWKGSVNNRKYAFFNTSVIADYDEQEEELLKRWEDTSLEGGAPLSGKKNAELINSKLKEKAEQKRRDVVLHLISHQIDPTGYVEFDDRKDLHQLCRMPMDLKDPQWRPVIELWGGYIKKESWAVEFMGLNGENIDH